MKGSSTQPRIWLATLVDQKRARELLDSLLLQMPEDLGVVLVLHDVERLTMAEIATTLELKPGPVASGLRRSRHDFDKHKSARVDAQPPALPLAPLVFAAAFAFAGLSWPSLDR